MKKGFLVILTVLLTLLGTSASFAARRALLVGIADYQSLAASPAGKGGATHLKGPLNDVRLIKNSLISYYDFSERDIKVLTNAEATRNNIESTFKQWLIQETQKGDLVVFYFAGHGSRVPYFKEGEYAQVLLPYDTVLAGGRNIIFNDELSSWVRKLEGRTAVIILDCCYAGGMVRSIRGNTVSQLEDSPTFRSRFLPITNYQPSGKRLITRSILEESGPESRIILAASKKDEAALEINFPQGTQGAFTFALCDGMKRLRHTSYEKLYEHTRGVVQDRLKLPQEPQLVAKREVMLQSFLEPPVKEESKPAPPAVAAAPASPPTSPPSPTSTTPPAKTLPPAPAAPPAEPLSPPPPPPVKTKPTASPAPEKSKPTPPPSPVTPPAPTAAPPLSPPPPAPAPIVAPPPLDNKPAAPPEIQGEKVLLAVEDLKGTENQEMNKLRKSLSQLPQVILVGEKSFYDRLLRGEKKNAKYQVRLLNLVGDMETLEPVATPEELVKQVNQRLGYAHMVKQLARIHHPHPQFKVKLSVTDESRRDFYLGEKLFFRFQTEKDCYILLLNMDGEGNFHVIFPNQFQQDNFVKANTAVTIPSEQNKRFEFEFSRPVGEETVKVIATTKPLKLEKLGIKDFKESFPVISGNTRALMVKEVIENINSNLTTANAGGEKFEWSEDTVVVRSHAPKNKM
jgi:hypothetical protein